MNEKAGTLFAASSPILNEDTVFEIVAISMLLEVFAKNRGVSPKEATRILLRNISAAPMTWLPDDRRNFTV